MRIAAVQQLVVTVYSRHSLDDLTEQEAEAEARKVIARTPTTPGTTWVGVDFERTGYNEIKVYYELELMEANR